MFRLAETQHWHAVQINRVFPTRAPLPLHSRLKARKLWLFYIRMGVQRDLRVKRRCRLDATLASCAKYSLNKRHVTVLAGANWPPMDSPTPSSDSKTSRPSGKGDLEQYTVAGAERH